MPIAGRPVRLVWAKRIWRCVEPLCTTATWTYIGAIGFASPGAVIVTLITMYNGDTPTTGDRIRVKLGYLVVALTVCSVPAFAGVMTRRRHTAGLPWFVLAGLTALCTVRVAVNASPFAGAAIYWVSQSSTG